MKRKFSRNEQVLLVVLVGIICMFFFMKNVYDPLTKDIKKKIALNNKLVTSINEMKSQPVESGYIKNSINQLDKSTADVKLKYDSLLSSVLVNHEQIQEKALEISGEVSDNGLVVREMAVLEKDNSSGSYYTANLRNWKNRFGLVSYSLKVDGDFLDFLNFFTEIVDKKQLIIIGNIKIKGINDQGGVTTACTMLF
jgi:hypothetical protein